jgi:hypothetical protein
MPEHRCDTKCQYEVDTESLVKAERDRCVAIIDEYYGGGRSFVMRKISSTASGLVRPQSASDEAVAKRIVQAVCELQDVPSPSQSNTLITTVQDLEAVIVNQIARPQSAAVRDGQLQAYFEAAEDVFEYGEAQAPTHMIRKLHAARAALHSTQEG